MYGFGSKKALVEDFASTALTDYSVVVINGYLQSVNLKQVSTVIWLIYNLTICMENEVKKEQERLEQKMYGDFT